MKLKVKRLRESGIIKKSIYLGDCGYDVYAIENRILGPGERFNMPLGLALQFSKKYFCIVQGKSGRANKEGLTTIGNIIDSSYRGEIHATLINLGNKHIFINEGEKVAQLIFVPYVTLNIKFVEKLSKSKRGDKGFGSSGLKK